jgi:ubiquinone/menaquinone biosynthesis C-methylase UbiE
MDKYHNINCKSLYMSKEKLLTPLIKVIRFSPQAMQLPEGKERDRFTLSMYEIIRKEASLGSNDNYIYKKLHDVVHKNAKNKKDNEDYNIYNMMDAKKIALDFISMIPETLKVKTFLDVGCGDGSITTILAEKLGIKKKNVHGTDVRNIDTNAFTFHLLEKEATRFSFLKDNSMDMVIASMSLHKLLHQEEIIKDIARVIKPKGLVIIFEHDANTADYEIVLNIMYGLYAMVWTNPMKDPKFIENYYAKYRSEVEWINLFKKEGFDFLEAGDKEPEALRNNCRFYMNSLQKK